MIPRIHNQSSPDREENSSTRASTTRPAAGSAAGGGLLYSHDADLGNRTLLVIVVCSLLAALTLLVGVVPGLGEFARPGSALLQSAAIAGSLMLLMSMVAVFGKRAGLPGRRGFRSHVWLACLGFVLVSVHTAGDLDRPPALLILALLALIILGVWARLPGAQRMAASFGTKSAALSPLDANTRAQLQTLIAHKHALLLRLDPKAEEGLFSLTPLHWLRTPSLAWSYQRLVTDERRLMGMRRSVSGAQAWWRVLHQLIALAFVTGLLVHVLVVTFFAGYVAQGREIYWWRLADWSF